MPKTRTETAELEALDSIGPATRARSDAASFRRIIAARQAVAAAEDELRAAVAVVVGEPPGRHRRSARHHPPGRLPALRPLASGTAEQSGPGLAAHLRTSAAADTAGGLSASDQDESW